LNDINFSIKGFVSQLICTYSIMEVSDSCIFILGGMVGVYRMILSVKVGFPKMDNCKSSSGLCIEMLSSLLYFFILPLQ
jgi:hypothetical protein